MDRPRRWPPQTQPRQGLSTTQDVVGTGAAPNRPLARVRSFLIEEPSPVSSSSGRGRRVGDSSWIMPGDLRSKHGILQRPLKSTKAEEPEQTDVVATFELSPRRPPESAKSEESERKHAGAKIEASPVNSALESDVTEPLPSTVILQGGAMIAVAKEGSLRETPHHGQMDLARAAISGASASQQRASTEAIARSPVAILQGRSTNVVAKDGFFRKVPGHEQTEPAQLAISRTSASQQGVSTEATVKMRPVISQGGSVTADAKEGVFREGPSHEQTDPEQVAISRMSASQQRASTEAIARTRSVILSAIAVANEGAVREAPSHEETEPAQAAISQTSASQQRASTEAIARTRCHSLDSIASRLAKMRQALPQFSDTNPAAPSVPTAPRVPRRAAQVVPALPHVGPGRTAQIMPAVPPVELGEAAQEEAFRSFQEEVRAELCAQAKKLQQMEAVLNDNLQALNGAVHEQIDNRVGELSACLEALRGELHSVAAEGETLRAELRAEPRGCACHGSSEQPATPRQQPAAGQSMLSKDLEPPPCLLQQRTLAPQRWPPEAMVAYDMTLQVLRDKIEDEFASCALAVREMVERSPQDEADFISECGPTAELQQQQQRLPHCKKPSRPSSLPTGKWVSQACDQDVESPSPPGRFYDADEADQAWCFGRTSMHPQVPFPKRRHNVITCH